MGNPTIGKNQICNMRIWVVMSDGMVAADKSAQSRRDIAHWHYMVGSEPDHMLVNTLSRLFLGARNEIFEDGMDSYFSANLHHTIREYGVAAVDALEFVMHDADLGAAKYALIQIGHMADDNTHSSRLSLLGRALQSPNASVRDAASSGIEAMEDPAAIWNIQKAIDCEPYKDLRQNLKDILAQLQDTE